MKKKMWLSKENFMLSVKGNWTLRISYKFRHKIISSFLSDSISYKKFQQETEV